MAAPRSTEPGDVHNQIVREASRLIAARGFDGMSLQDIADAVGVSKPAVLHHFPSKEHIRVAVLEDVLAHWRETLPRLLMAVSAGEGRFDAIFGELQRFFRENPDRAKILVRENLDRPEETRKLLRGPVRPWLSAVAGSIKTGEAEGRVHADLDAEAYVLLALQMVIFTSALGPVVTIAISEGAEGGERYYREAARMAKSALFPPRSNRSR